MGNGELVMRFEINQSLTTNYPISCYQAYPTFLDIGKGIACEIEASNPFYDSN